VVDNEDVMGEARQRDGFDLRGMMHKSQQILASKSLVFVLYLRELDSALNRILRIRQTIVQRLCCAVVLIYAHGFRYGEFKVNLIGDDHDPILLRVAPAIFGVLIRKHVGSVL
jgi:hypothetical protein